MYIYTYTHINSNTNRFASPIYIYIHIYIYIYIHGGRSNKSGLIRLHILEPLYSLIFSYYIKIYEVFFLLQDNILRFFNTRLRFFFIIGQLTTLFFIVKLLSKRYTFPFMVTANLRNQIFPGIPNPLRESGESVKCIEVPRNL